ncbi:MAG: transglutaminase family protein [Acidimicrobiales bacterium]
MAPPDGSGPARLNELLAAAEPGLDRILAVIATVDADEPPAEEDIVAAFDHLAIDVEHDDSPQSILDHVFGQLGFSGDVSDYYSPANSLIHRVLERRRGIPMTLAAVASEVARRCGMDLRLVGLPGHILLGQGPEPKAWFDPFNGGARLGYEDCRLLFAKFHPIESFSPAMLAPIDAEMISIRMLNNLRVAYTKRGDAGRTVPVLEMRAEMSSADVGDRLELAGVLAMLGRYDRAADEFERLAELDPPRADAYNRRARSYRAHRN